VRAQYYLNIDKDAKLRYPFVVVRNAAKQIVSRNVFQNVMLQMKLQMVPQKNEPCSIIQAEMEQLKAERQSAALEDSQGGRSIDDDLTLLLKRLVKNEPEADTDKKEKSQDEKAPVDLTEQIQPEEDPLKQLYLL